jgi:hypothetical protein
MKRYVDKVRSLMGKEPEEMSVLMMAFWLIIAKYGDLVRVKIGDEYTSMKLERQWRTPYRYVTAPLDRANAEALAGTRLPDGMAYTLEIFGRPGIMVQITEEFGEGPYPVPIEQVKILD